MSSAGADTVGLGSEALRLLMPWGEARDTSLVAVSYFDGSGDEWLIYSSVLYASRVSVKCFSGWLMSSAGSCLRANSVVWVYPRSAEVAVLLATPAKEEVLLCAMSTF